MAEDTTGRGGGGKWPEGECGQDPQTGDRRQRESRVLLAGSPSGFTRVDLVPPKVPASWRLGPILVLWGFIACCRKGLLPAGLFLPGNTNPRLLETLPGMDETATLGGSVILQTHGCGKS